MATESETSQETRTCERHGDYVATTRVSTIPFLTWTTRCPVCDSEALTKYEREEAEWKERKRRERIAECRMVAGIPARFAACSFENYVAGSLGQKHALSTAKGFAENFKPVMEAGSSLIFCGKWGTGKTHLAFAIANHLLESERTVKYTTVAELIREIRGTWRRDSKQTEDSVIRKFQNASLLILDEVGSSFGGEAEERQLFDVLDGRYRETRPSVIISNLNAIALQECLGPQLYDRLIQNGSAVVVFDWNSYRSEAKIPCSPHKPAAPADEQQTDDQALEDKLKAEARARMEERRKNLQPTAPVQAAPLVSLSERTRTMREEA